MAVNVNYFQRLFPGQLAVVFIPGAGQSHRWIVSQHPVLNAQDREWNLRKLACQRVMAGALAKSNDQFASRICQHIDLAYWVTHRLEAARDKGLLFLET